MAENESKNELAEERTHFAEDRTVQATERTFAGWIRTAFAAIGVGVGFHALFGELQPLWLPKSIASLFILLAAAIAYTAERRACRTFGRLKAHEVAPFGTPSIRWVSWSVIAASLALIAALWLLHEGSPATQS
jgi:putative membrane protein